MRALTQEEYEALRAHDQPAFIIEDGGRFDQTCARLVERGLYVKSTYLVNDEEWTEWTITPLGLLALRVSRPEMAYQL